MRDGYETFDLVWCEYNIEISTYILTWLDAAARDPNWARYLEDSKQLKLF